MKDYLFLTLCHIVMIIFFSLLLLNNSNAETIKTNLTVGATIVYDCSGKDIKALPFCLKNVQPPVVTIKNGIKTLTY